MWNAAAWFGALLATVLLGACGGPPPNPATLLSEAKQSVDGAQTAHFELSTSNTKGLSGTALLGGSGDIKRPSSFAGTLQVSAVGLEVSVQVVSVGGTFYARDPLTGRFTVTDPATYGFGDPGALFNPQTGLSSLLLVCQQASTASDDRLNGEQLHEVSCTLPGRPVASLLTSADPSKPVSATIGVNADSGQLRRVVMTGPFFSATMPSTFTLVLDKYGENVSITPPAAAS
ncbi:MAG: LppX_LprAFG lipoprotein [Candidatus Dormibacteraeota bacterium]|nr:LppX_LprAFG lipoprotein [Candidatus Dormibacteraeota bacterium]